MALASDRPITTVATPAAVPVLITATHLSATSVSCPSGLVLRAPSTNAEPVYLGGSAIVAGLGDVLAPGDRWATDQPTDLRAWYAITAGGGSCTLVPTVLG